MTLSTTAGAGAPEQKDFDGKIYRDKNGKVTWLFSNGGKSVLISSEKDRGAQAVTLDGTTFKIDGKVRASLVQGKTIQMGDVALDMLAPTTLSEGPMAKPKVEASATATKVDEAKPEEAKPVDAKP